MFVMADVANLNIKIDRDLKLKADRLFNDMGMNLTTAVNVFIKQAVMERAMPFKTYQDLENTVTTVSVEQRRAAMQEIRDLLAGVDGNSVDLEQMKAERTTNKFECVD